MGKISRVKEDILFSNQQCSSVTYWKFESLDETYFSPRTKHPNIMGCSEGIGHLLGDVLLCTFLHGEARMLCCKQCFVLIFCELLKSPHMHGKRLSQFRCLCDLDGARSLSTDI